MCITVWRAQVRDCSSHVLKADYPIQPRSLQLRFPLQFKPKLEKERLGGSQVVYDDTHMIDSADLHVSFPFQPYITAAGGRRCLPAGGSAFQDAGLLQTVLPHR